MKSLLINRKLFINQLRKMSCFTQILNPITGKTEWESQSEDYDYHQEVARAAFADMLHDTERNQKYYQALRIAVEKKHKQGLKAKVLDIGTGTGLLSMMAVKCGADIITACEAFAPMADCAEKIMTENGMRDRISLVKKRSTELTVGGEGADMPEKANILVTEVFDTELIGEGAIGTFTHAHKHLLEKDCIVVPDRATIYIQVVESGTTFAWNRPKLIANLDGEVLLQPPPEILNCPGTLSLHDIQLSQLPLTSFNTIIPPMAVLEFDWSGKKPLPKTQTIKKKVLAKQSGVAQTVFMWWDLKMDEAGEIILSCAPYWAHPDIEQLARDSDGSKTKENLIPWRDHWMQALYYFPKDILITEGEEFTVISNHDEYSLWFEVIKGDVDQPVKAPACNCGFHIANSRTRIGQQNHSLRNKKYLKFLEEQITKTSICLSTSDGTLLGLIASKMGAEMVYCLETNRYNRQVTEAYIKTNQLKNIRIVESVDEINDDDLKGITHILAEPNFLSTILPWDHFYYGNLLRGIKKRLNDDVVILPKRAIIYAAPVEFLDLHKIRTPLGVCEGFDLKIFDELIEKSSHLADTNVEAQPLWEYPSKSLGKPKELLSIQFTDFDQTIERNGTLLIDL